MAVLLLLVAGATADDGLKAWKDEQRRLEKLEQKYWQEFQKRYNDALVTFEKPRIDAAARPNDPGNYVYDYSELRNLYADHALIEEAKGKADLAFATSNDPKALPELFEALMNVAKRIDDVEAQHLGARPQQGGSWFDQRPGIERHGLEVRVDALLRAITQCPDAVPFLADEGMKAAAKKDGRRSIVRRVAVIDALGLVPKDEAVAALAPFAGAPESSLRIAALEALLRHGARAAAEPLLADKCAPVRRALLQGIATAGANDPGWIEPVLAAYGNATGLVRDDCVRALEALTGQKFGDAKALWEEWFADYKNEISGGKFKKEAIEVREAKREAPFTACTFYGIPTPSLGVILVLEGSRRIYWPADVDALKKQYKETWHRTRRAWEEINPSLHATLMREFDKTVATISPDVSLGAIVLYAGCEVEPIGARKLASPDKKEIRGLRRDLEKLQGDGWCPQYEGLLGAAALAGMPAGGDGDFPDARADTIYLWDSGGPEGGRYMTPESAVAAFRRFNRFRRLVVHAIRIGDEGEPAETLMKGFAEASGGTYAWVKKP